MAITYKTKKHKACKSWQEFLRGQRRINGEFVLILDGILDGLNDEDPYSKRKRALKAAATRLGKVAGIDPPGCNGSKDGGGGGH